MGQDRNRRGPATGLGYRHDNRLTHWGCHLANIFRFSSRYIEISHFFPEGPCSGNGLVPNRCQAITWNNDDPIHLDLYISPSLDGLIKLKKLISLQTSSTYQWSHLRSCVSPKICWDAATLWASSPRSYSAHCCVFRAWPPTRWVSVGGTVPGSLWRVPCGWHRGPIGSCDGAAGWSWSRSPGSSFRWCMGCNIKVKWRSDTRWEHSLIYSVKKKILKILLLLENRR